SALQHDYAPPTPLATPKAPTADLTPATYRAPNVQAWMHQQPTTASNAPPRRLALMDVPQPVAGRRAHFIMVGNDTADLTGLHGTKVRVTLVPGPVSRMVHVK